jgi:hypothetical protein
LDILPKIGDPQGLAPQNYSLGLESSVGGAGLGLGMLSAGRTARSIVTKAALENAIAAVYAVGGSTNAVLHLLAIAHEAGVKVRAFPEENISVGPDLFYI